MGNNCCRDQGENWLEGTGVDDGLQMSNLPTTASRPKSSWSDPQRKTAEYYDILRQMQTDNLQKMREQLKKKPELFLLNNLVLSIQFFDNFQR